jgi:hypothetical protein
VDDQRRRRTKDEIATLLGEHKITQEMRAQRLRWLGNVKRLPENRFTKQAIYVQKKTRGKEKERETKQKVDTGSRGRCAQDESDSVEKEGKE